MKKPIVSTRTIGKQDKINKIINELKKYPEGITPKLIALYTGINHSTVKGLMRKIPQVECISNLKGLYRLVPETGDNAIFTFNFHNLIVGVFLPNYQNETIKKSFSCELINYEFIIGKETKKATLRISTPKIDGTDYPINLSSIILAFALFKELIFRYANENITPKDVIINSIEFNKDFKNLKLEGVNCITLESMLEQFKIYQKTDKLRLEHKIKVPINMQELLKLLGADKQ